MIGSLLIRARMLASAIAIAAGLACAAQADAASNLYMTGASNPWGQNTEDQAMDLAFGSGGWDKLNGFDAAQLTAGYSFIYLDGGDGTSTEFNSFVTSNLAGIENFVSGGGRILLNAGRWDQPTIDLGFGTSLAEGYSNSASLTADGLSAGLDAGGAGTSWTGSYFSHDTVSGVDTCYVVGTAGCAFGSKGAGLFVGGQTAPYFQSGGALQLRANELSLAANGAASPTPEPASWALMMIGFGAIGGAMRSRRRTAVSFG